MRHAKGSSPRFSQATRIVLTLDYAGLSHVSWLDGGLKAWKDAGQPVSKDSPLPRTGTLAPLKLRPVVVDADFVKAHIGAPHFAIVDARNLLDPAAMRRRGFAYQGVGRR